MTRAVILVGALLIAPALAGGAVADTIRALDAFLPTARDGTSAVWAGGEAFVFGGQDVNGALIDVIVRFVPAGDGGTVGTAATLSGGRQYAPAVWDGASAWLLGGYGSGGGLAQVVKFTPPSSVTTYANALASPRFQSSAVRTGSNVYVFGGCVSSCGSPASDEILRYDTSAPFTAAQPLTVKLPSARFATAAAFDGTYAYVIGGVASGAITGQIVRFHPASGNVRVMDASIPGGITGASAAWDGARILVFGGGNDAAYSNRIYSYDPVSDRVDQLSTQLPSARSSTSAVWDGDRAFVFGGHDGGQPLNHIVRFGPTPLAPGALTAERGPQAGQISLTWQPASSGPVASSYKVLRATTPGGQSATPVGQPTATSFTDTGLSAGVTYYYKVVGVNVNGDGVLSAEEREKAPERPQAPTSFSTAAGTVTGEIRGSWIPPTDTGGIPLTGFNVYRGTTSGALSLWRTLAPEAASFVESGLPNGAFRCYRVGAVNGVGESALAPESCANAPDLPGAPASPATSRGPGVGQITVTWQPPASTGFVPVLAYKIYRSAAAGGAVEPGFPVTIGNVASWTDSGLARGAQRYYRVSAVNLVGEGPKSAEVRGQAPDLPGAPLDVAAAPDPAGPASILVSWRAPDDGGMPITRYRVHRTTVEAGETWVTEIDATTSYRDSRRLPGIRYYYRVVAVNGVGAGPSTPEVSARPSAVPTTQDADGDLLVDAAERRLCNTPLTQGAIDDLGGLAGVCGMGADWEALGYVDADDDAVPDALEPDVCSATDPSDPADGICVDQDGDGTLDDWGLPPGA